MKADVKVTKLTCSFFSNIFLVQGTEEQYLKFLEDVCGDKYQPTCAEGKTHFFYDKEDMANIAIWIKKQKNKHFTTVTAYHEVGHAVFMAFREMQQEVCEENEEIFLYTQEDLYNQIISNLNK